MDDPNVAVGNQRMKQIDHWEPGCWVVALLKLCGPFQVETESKIVRYPEQWTYFLWRPMERALPHVTPDCFTLTVGAPLDDLATKVGSNPVYILRECECDWPSWLEILLVCDNNPPWLREIIEARQDEKRREMRHRLQYSYGPGDEFEFQSFIMRVLEVKKLPP